MHIKHFTVITKVSERCNINCDYCYYFNIGDDSWKDNPAYMSQETMATIYHRFERLLDSAKIERLTFVFHGGEPLLAKTLQLEWFVNTLKRLENRTRVAFSIQTNGTILSEEWLGFFERTRMAIGISIDGPPEYNDAHRRTKQNKPTHDLVANFIKQCEPLARDKKISALGTITVINNKFDIGKIVGHLQDNFDLTSMSFIMPDDAANDILLDSRKSSEYGQALINLYNESIVDKRIRSKEIMKFMSKLEHGRDDDNNDDETGRIDYVGVTIQSNGILKVNEELIATGAWRKNFPTINLKSVDIYPYIESPRFKEYLRATSRIPEKCSDCTWKNVCRGGSLQERKKPENGFNERSVFCGAYKQLYGYMYEDLVKHGYPEEILRKKIRWPEDESDRTLY